MEPNPDIHNLLVLFNEQYFWGTLGHVSVRWSTKMTLCAGTCTWNSGGFCDIALSEPLLKFRPTSDLIDTLLHEMIHAYLFLVTRGRLRDRNGHGPEFLAHAKRINARAGTRISVYHSFRDEVDHYRVHVWKCDGPCRHRAPYFGLVKRSLNRPPQKADRWWAEHQRTCGGTFHKIKGPKKHTAPTIPSYFKPTTLGTSPRGHPPRHLLDDPLVECPHCDLFLESSLLHEHVATCHATAGRGIEA